MILAQVAGYSLIHLLIVLIIVGACIGIAPVALSAVWIVAVVAIFAIRFVSGL